ncbi:DRMBL-domain-containing protein [Flagelloscypha sp. PMI_526]|nr:DRMBL-domain-containing protein [Flagelloscypha sp. PMI_526]
MTTSSVNSAFSVLMASNADDAAWKEADAADNRPGRLSNNKGSGNRRKAPFYKVLQGMPIAVDAFCYGKIPKVTAYFLTHAHSDHYTNLSSNWKHGPIYASEATCNLIVHMLGVDRKWICPLPFNVPTPVPNTDGVQVTLIEANHCPGSCLFFFEGKQTIDAGDSIYTSPHVGGTKIWRYLHCGDFRACPEHVLHPQVKGKRIDHVYLDTTYLDPKYTFPPQPLVIDACADLAQKINAGCKAPSTPAASSIASWAGQAQPATPKPDLTKHERVLFVVGTYSIGKERIVKAVAKAVDSKVYCDARKADILRCQPDSELHDLLTIEPLAAQVHILPLGMISSDKLAMYAERFKGAFTKVVGFRPTGWTFTPATGSAFDISISSIISKCQSRRYTSANLQPSRQSTTALQLYPVPYSEHSSFFELTAFALSLDGGWGKMIATVNVGSEASRKKMAKWVERWEKERKRREGKAVEPRDATYW